MPSYPIELSGCVTLVTGGSRGIGAAVSLAAAEAGSRVAVHYRRDRAAAERVVALCRERGVEAAAFPADMASPGEVARLFDEAGRALGPVDRVVANAGIWKRAPIDEMTEEDLREMLEVNLVGVFRTMREWVARLGERSGAAVLVASTAGQRGEAFHSHYAASKGGVISLTKSLASELAPRARVNCVAPGWVRTDMSVPSLEADPAYEKWVMDSIPMRRIADPAEIAAPVVFLLSERASFITGEIFNVNGGAVLVG